MIDRRLLNYPEQLAMRLSKIERDVDKHSKMLRNGVGGDCQGVPGPKGDPGPPGPANVLSIGTVTSGATASATITGTSPAQVLSLVLPKGDKGDTGNPGAAATIAVGTTTTLTPGSSATVTNSGTSSAAVFDFGIPKGDKGDTGNPGADGFSPIANVAKVGDTATITITDENGTTTATVTDGAAGPAATIAAGTTTTLPAGSSATVTNSGTSSAAVFDFGIPKGDTGAAGQDGADGADGFSPIATVSKSGDTATITITDANGTTTASVADGSDGAPGAAATIAAGTTTTLSPGSSATVTNSGTSSAAVFDFGIPQGATGAPGADGADGADGYSPTATVSKVGDTATITITDQNGTTTASVSDGATGSPGPANTLSIGTVQSGATADATITGTSPNQTLNLTLPQGTPGTSATVAVGTTITLPAGSSATVTNSGTSSAAVFDFGIPTGADGAKGDPGKGCPVGSILPFAGSTIPDNYLECDGSAVSRTTYADLFAVIGTTYGAGDGSTTFNLPNIKGKVTVGQDTGDTSFDTLGETGGSAEHQHNWAMQTRPWYGAIIGGGAELVMGAKYDSSNTRTFGGTGVTSDNSKFDDTKNSGLVTSTNHGGGGATAYEYNTSNESTLQPYIVTKYIIKYADAAATVADVLNAHSTSSTDVYSASYINSLSSYYDKTANNLTPTSDTTADWVTLFSNTSTTGVPQTDGYFVTYYSNAGCFTNQPSQWGFLETFIHGNDVYQRWHTQNTGAILYRSGNSSGWNPSGGAWTTTATTGQLSSYLPTANINLTTTDPGKNSSLAANHFTFVYEN